MDKITFAGGRIAGNSSILPVLAQFDGVTQGFSTFFGGTSLLIMVGVILDTLQQIETQLLMRQYEWINEECRIQGRQQQPCTDGNKYKNFSITWWLAAGFYFSLTLTPHKGEGNQRL